MATLVVDDEFLLRKIARRILRTFAQGAHVLVVLLHVAGQRPGRCRFRRESCGKIADQL